jgi:hypothetical protein
LTKIKDGSPTTGHRESAQRTQTGGSGQKDKPAIGTNPAGSTAWACGLPEFPSGPSRVGRAERTVTEPGAEAAFTRIRQPDAVDKIQSHHACGGNAHLGRFDPEPDQSPSLTRGTA